MLPSIDRRRPPPGRAPGPLLGTLLALALGGCDALTGTDRPRLSVEIVAPSQRLPVGESVTLRAVVRESEGSAVAGTRVTWTSDATGVATVTDAGVVSGIAPGTARVTATAGAASASVSLTVDEAGRLLPIVNSDAAGRPLTRFDAAGNALDLHGGEIRLIDGLYHWYGEHYACGYQWTIAGTPFCGFRVHTSPDLARWTDRGPLFPLEPVWQVLCDGKGSGCFRPHVARSARTGRWVLWVNGYDAPGGYYVFDAESPVGPFQHRPDPTLAVGGHQQRGDHNLFVDRDGSGWLAYTLWPRGDIVIEELTPDLLSGTGRHAVLGLEGVEAPTLFRRGERYYLLVADPSCGYCETGTSYRTAPHPLGPWSRPRRLSETSCGGQPGHVSELPAADGGSWYLFHSDRWNHRERNQATATQYIAPLVFDDEGGILPLACAATSHAPVLLAPGVAPQPDVRGRLVCDIGGVSGAHRVQRELRFTAHGGGLLRGVELALYQQGAVNSRWGGSPDAPLVLELFGGGRRIERVELAPGEVAWSARATRIDFDEPLADGAEYRLRLSAEPTRGCYGVAYQEGIVGVSGLGSFVSADGGSSWTPEPGRDVFFRADIQPD